MAKYSVEKRDGEILHAVIQSVEVGPCEGGSDSAMPGQTSSLELSLLQYVLLIIHDVCVEKKCMLVSLHGSAHENVTADQKCVNNK